MDFKPFTLICGHYGCGKTNLSLNIALDLAARGEKVTLVDMDVVNPYFRSSDYRQLIQDAGVRLFASAFAGGFFGRTFVMSRGGMARIKHFGPEPIRSSLWAFSRASRTK